MTADILSKKEKCLKLSLQAFNITEQTAGSSMMLYAGLFSFTFIVPAKINIMPLLLRWLTQ